MTEKRVADLLSEAIFEHEELADLVADVRSFKDAELLTTNEGIVIRLAGGEEFQITVRRSH